ncbi:hypothetical protein ACLB2K_039121 [Fragaria x ananassa]
MKFGKEFVAQMVPEWQEAYMNYSYLKSLIKIIQHSKHRNKPHPQHHRLSLYSAFAGLTRSRHHQEPTSPSSDIENQAILVHAVRSDGGSHESYETTFLMAAEEGGVMELEYFRRADDEFNKVEKFFRGKVAEVMKEASALNKQMDALIAFRIKVENPQRLFDWSCEMTRPASDVAASTAQLAASIPRGAKASRRAMEFIEEGGSSSSQGENSSEDDKDEKRREDHNIDNQKLNVEKPNRYIGAMPAPLEVLNRVTMNQTVETPRSTIKGLLNVPQQTELKFTRENLKKVEQQLRGAFIEFYQKLRLLKSYGFLNILAFSKIMKKYDKVTSRNTSKPYMNMVDNSYVGSSDEVTKLIERVEITFIKQFSNSNRRKGMAVLRPKPKKERHSITFSMGCLAGCTAALTVTLILIVRARHIMDHSGTTQYMENIFPLYSLFAFVFLHMVMYSGNIYFWRRYRVNYSFIFGFKQGTELGYREVLLVSFGMAVLALGAALSNLDMEMDPQTQDYKALTELLPLFLVLLVVVILLCPFNIVYRSSRYFFLVCVFHCICAPLYKVTLPDFFLADQLTSQVQAIRSLEFYICYYGWGDYKHRNTTCRSNDVFNTFSFIVASIPYWSRLLQVQPIHRSIKFSGYAKSHKFDYPPIRATLMFAPTLILQCIRRLFEEKDPQQGYNGVKYFLTIVAVIMRTAYSHNKDVNFKILAGIFSIVSAVYCTYWDLVVDWGLLQRNSRNRWLRDKLLVPYKSVYFAAMVSNINIQ